MLSVFIISLLGILVYSSTLFCPFNFDDMPSIMDNFAIKNIHHLYDIWHFWPCRFITYLSFAINYHFHQLDVLGYHLVNIAIHLGSAILVWWLTLLTLATPAMKDNKITRHAEQIALLTALVFVAHPVQTQAVTYIVQRAASLAAFFYLASLCCYAKSRLLFNRLCEEPMATRQSLKEQLKARIYFICSLIFAVFAMFTKENTISLPLIILLYEYSFLKMEKRLNWPYLVPVLLAVFVIPLTVFFTGSGDINAKLKMADMSYTQYFLTQLRVMVTYIRLAFLPYHQNLDYDYPISQSIFELPTLISLVFLGSILYWAKYLFKEYRLLSFSILWFFLTLLPESGLLPLPDVIFEHRLYLPLVGYSLFLVSGAYYLGGSKRLKMIVLILLMGIVTYSFLTYQRNRVWRDNFTLWDDAVRKSPHKARAYGNRGFLFCQQGKYIQGIADLTMAIRLNPNYAKAYCNRGKAYSELGKFTQAITDYNKTIELQPGFALAYNNRGVVDNILGNDEQAVDDFTKSIKLNPYFPGAYDSRGRIYLQKGNLAQAIEDFTKVIALSPSDVEAYSSCGYIYDKQGQFAQALRNLNKAIQINSRYADAFINRGDVYFHQGNLIQAIADYNKVIEINPQCSLAYENLAVVYYQLKEYDKAWGNVHLAQKQGITVNPTLINLLRQVSSA